MKLIGKIIILLFALYGFFTLVEKSFSYCVVESENKFHPPNVPQGAVFYGGCDGSEWYYLERIKGNEFLFCSFDDDWDNDKYPARPDFVGRVKLKIEGWDKKIVSNTVIFKMEDWKRCGNNDDDKERMEIPILIKAKLISEHCVTFDEYEDFLKKYNKDPEGFLNQLRKKFDTENMKNGK